MKKIYSGALALVGLVSVLFVGPLIDAPELHARGGGGTSHVCEDYECDDPSAWVDSTALFYLKDKEGNPTECQVEVKYRTRTCSTDSEFEIMEVTPQDLDYECRDLYKVGDTIDHAPYIEQAEYHIASDPTFPTAPGFRPQPRKWKEVRGYTSNCWRPIASPVLSPLKPCTEHCCHKLWQLYGKHYGGVYGESFAFPYKGGSMDPVPCPDLPGSACRLTYDCRGENLPTAPQPPQWPQ